MKLILKYLKPFAVVVLLCLALLFGQAICDLSLPNLMSDIVNTGIQLGGIEEGAPKILSENGFQLMQFFMTESDREAFSEAYTLKKAGTAGEKYEKTYPACKNEDVYLFSPDSDAIQSKAEAAYGKATYAFMLYMQDAAKAAGTTGTELGAAVDTETGVQDIEMNQLYGILPILSLLPEETLSPYVEKASAADPMLRSQIGTTFTKLFYKELGTELDDLQQNYIWKTGGKMLLVALLGVAATVVVGFFAARISSKIAQRMRHDIFEKVNRFTGAEFDKFSTASLITRTTNDVQQVQMLIVMGIRLMCYAPIMGIGGVIMAVGKSVSMSWIIAVAVLVLLGLILILFALAMPKFKILQKLIDKLNLVSRENLSGLMVIRAFGTEQHEEQRFDAANRDLTDTNRYVQRAMAFMMPAMMLIMNLVSLVIVWVGAHQIADSALQIGDMMAFIQYAMQIIMAFLMIAMMFIMVPRASVSAVRISEVLNCAPSVLDSTNSVPLENVKGVVEFKNVSFRYDKAENDVIENISFRALPGQTTAFIGATGSGKSTLVNLIPRFYDVTGGSIEIDGVDIRNVPQKELRENIGYVPQKGILFSGDIASNVRYGRETASDAEVWNAIEAAQAKDFVSAKEEGILAPIAQGGTNVSGGQKQRLSIARALAKHPPIYIFDDSFSALDFKTDAALRKALKESTEEATVFIVAQRVSTIMHAEQIIVLDGGKMVGKGTHSELLATCPEYREIAESQLSKEELA